MQLYQPLGFLGFVYMTIKQSIVDMEQMFSLLEVKPEIADRPGAKPLAAHEGALRFEGVHFGYRPDREILKGVDFVVPPGASWRSLGRRVLANPPSAGCCSASTT
jgi:ATP-binding cassette subfamily B protein